MQESITTIPASDYSPLQVLLSSRLAFIQLVRFAKNP
jgi:hypothetical protein